MGASLPLFASRVSERLQRRRRVAAKDERAAAPAVGAPEQVQVVGAGGAASRLTRPAIVVANLVVVSGATESPESVMDCPPADMLTHLHAAHDGCSVVVADVDA
jgi:hypothetical protein